MHKNAPAKGKVRMLDKGGQMKIKLKYDRGYQEIDFQSESNVSLIQASETTEACDEDEIMHKAIKNPIDSKRLRDIVKPGETVAIVTSDISRPMPSYKVLPFVISELYEAGLKDSNIKIVLALGSHRGHTEEEKIKLVGSKIYASNIDVIDSDMDDCVHLGTCKNKTPVDVFSQVVTADRVVCLGNIEYHYFAGYSGGAKAIMPGVSSRRAIQTNHKNMLHEKARAACLDENPVRQDIDQVADFINIDFIVNLVLSPKKEILGAFSGHVIQAHRAGCKFLDSVYGAKITTLYDIVILSPGGFPKDSNLYQAQKGLANAVHAIKDGGTLILLAAAKEGFGEDNFEKWMLNKSPKERVKDISEDFILGGHKAAAIGQIQLNHTIIMVTDLRKEVVESCGFKYAIDLEGAVRMAFEEQGQSAKILVMPTAGSTLPKRSDG